MNTTYFVFAGQVIFTMDKGKYTAGNPKKFFKNIKKNI